jgi:hypothetical protein
MDNVAVDVGAISTLFIAVAGVIAALTLFLPVLRSSRSNAKKLDAVEIKVDGVHTIVNQRYTDILNFNRALVRALEGAGIEVPVDQSVPEPTPPLSPGDPLPPGPHS